MNLDAWELLKNNGRTNNLAWVRELPIVSYGVVTKVLDAQTVEVDAVIQESVASHKSYTVSLLSLSSALFELSIQPHVNDLVLLLFQNKYDPAMFNSPGRREEKTGRKTLLRPNATGYTRFSGTGILMRTLKASSAITASVSGDDEELTAQVTSVAKIGLVFKDDVRELYTCQPDDEDPHPVSRTYDTTRPVQETFLAKVLRFFGVSRKPDGTLDEVDAPVYEEYSVYAPITKSIQGKQTYQVGYDADGKATEAPVTFDLGEKAPVTLTTKSDVTVEFAGDAKFTFKAAKAVNFDFGTQAPFAFKAGGGLQIEVGAGKKADIKNSTDSLASLIGALLDELVKMKTVGSPAQHVVSPDNIASLMQIKAKWDLLFGS